MRKSLFAMLLLASTVLAKTVAASASETMQREFPASIIGHALLPAGTFVPAPADAPADLRSAGKYTQGSRRNEAIGTVMGLSQGRPTGISLPFNGQPVQGFSGIRSLGNSEFLILMANGMGSKANSPDAMLAFLKTKVDFVTGVVGAPQMFFLHDPDKKIPFRITHEGTEKRYLTGADFDPESIQNIGNKLWIGEEFGLYLIRTDASGKVEAVFETMIDGKSARSPDHFAVVTPPTPDATAPFNVRRSRGFEGMAASPDGRFLYPMLEGPVWDAEAKTWEKKDGREALRILEFDVAAEKWTGRSWFYVLERDGLAIGDFNMIDATTALVIERDNGEGTADKACPEGQRRPDCFHDIAKFKRVVKIELLPENTGKLVHKIGFIDLMNIKDPEKKARVGAKDGVFTFPFFTIENVDIVDRANGVIVIGNHNNLPISSSRDPNKADDNELVLLSVKELLEAK